jgi:hypothetical protein
MGLKEKREHEGNVKRAHEKNPGSTKEDHKKHEGFMANIQRTLATGKRGTRPPGSR